MELNKDSFEKCPPRADAMIQSMRAVGYDVSMAISDIIDNSISAKAKNIWISHKWAGKDSFIQIVDDGEGMSEKELFNAMRLGSLNPLETRDPNDLGRFGMGLKTASFSQCKLLTVRSKKNNLVSTRCWDLNLVEKEKEWLLVKREKFHSKKYLTNLEDKQSGTIVLWQNLDRLINYEGFEGDDETVLVDDFLRKIDEMHKYLSMIFHRYLENPSRLNIHVLTGEGSYVKLKAWDPFLKLHSATQELSSEAHNIFGDTISIRPFVLPHVSKLSTIDHQKAAGPQGWNAQQGIYLYRKERLIVSGGWLNLGYKQEEHYKLARIQLDIPNNMDSEWQIDVKKATAKLPDAFRNDLKRLSKITREKASDIYRHRGKTYSRKYDKVNKFVWKKTGLGSSAKYQIDKKHPIIEDLMGQMGDSLQIVKRLIRLVEATVPIETIIISNAEHPDSHRQISELKIDDKNYPVKEWFIDQVQIEKLKGLDTESAFKKVMNIEPFTNHPELISLKEEYE